MDGKEAKAYIGNARDYRREIAKPLHNPTTPPETRTKTIEELRTLHELNHEDPDYRQALRVIAELRSQRNVNEPKEKVIKKKAEFPTDPEERFKAIISSIGNHAGKQISFLSLPSAPGTYITSWELYKEFLDNSAHAWKVNERLPVNHTTHSLIPIGMAAEEVVFRDRTQTKTIGFTQTEAGHTYGDPIARFLLKYAAEHAISLEKILGATVAKKDYPRAPYNRSTILLYLEQNKDKSTIRIVDICSALNMDPGTVGHALPLLQDARLLISQSINMDDIHKQFPYSLNPKFSGPIEAGHGKKRFNNVLQAIKTLQEQGAVQFDRNDVFDVITKSIPDFPSKVVGFVLSDLLKKGYLNRGQSQNSVLFSTVTILQEGVDFARDVLLPIKTALTDTPEGEAIRRRWRQIPWQNYAAKALQTHRETSNMVQQKASALNSQKVKEIIVSNPGIRSSEIQQELIKLGIPHKSIGIYVNQLLKNGEIKNETQGRASRWYPVIPTAET